MSTDEQLAIAKKAMREALAVCREGQLIAFNISNRLRLGRAALSAQSAQLKHRTKEKTEVTVAKILRKVAAHFRIKASDLTGDHRINRVSYPRQITMYLARQLTLNSLPTIGRLIGNRDHTTILHGIRKIGAERAIDPKLDALLTKFEDELTSGQQENVEEGNIEAAMASRVSRATKLRCLKCGKRLRYGRWTMCRQCLTPIWQTASRKAASSLRKKKALARGNQ